MSSKIINIGGREYPVIGAVKSDTAGYVPVLDIKFMSDEKWNELANMPEQVKWREEHPELVAQAAEMAKKECELYA